jgi:hypothetical protein
MPTLPHILSTMKRFRDPKKLSFLNLELLQLDIAAAIGVKTLMFEAAIKGSTGNLYKTIIRFSNVKFTPERQTYKGKSAIVGDAHSITFFEPINVRQHNMMTKCACFTGDTLIPLLNGNSVPIKDLVSKEKFFVYSYDTIHKKIVIGEGYNCKKYAENAELIEIVLDTGYKVKCTPDHMFLTKLGEWVEAKNLKPNMSLEPLYRKIGSKSCVKNYEQVYQGNGIWEFTHHLTDKFNNIKVNSGFIRHHKDFNKFNNSPDNIDIMHYSEHRRFHASLLKTNNPMFNKEIVAKNKKANKLSGKLTSERLKTNNPMFNKEIVAKNIQTRRENNSLKFIHKNFKIDNNEVKIKMVNTRKSKGLIGQNFDKCLLGLKKSILNKTFHSMQQEHKQKMSLMYKNGTNPLFKNPSRYTLKAENVRKWLLALPNGEYKLTHDYINLLGYTQYGHMLRGVQTQVLKIPTMRYDHNLRTLYKNDINFNHKVIAINKITEKQDVYCFSVKNYENFVIDVESGKSMSSGVVVHNCPDYRFRFEKEDYDNKFNIGNWRRYEDYPGRYRVNPEHIPGICKHILFLLSRLKSQGYVKE